MRPPTPVDIRTKLSTLWVVVLLNMIFADIFSIMVELVQHNTLAIPGEVRTVMAIAALVTNVPILMVYFARVLPYRVNRRANLTAAVLTIVYVVGGGDWAPHYAIMAALEVVILLVIFVRAWQWPEPETRPNPQSA